MDVESGDFVYSFFGAIFFLLAPVLLGIRFVWKRPPWWVIVALIVLVGWAAYFLFVISYFEYLWALMESQDNPDQDLVDRATADGGPMVVALFGGWLIALLYAIPWWLIYLIATWLRSLLSGTRNA